ncbi:hypothetical protein KCP71_09140 [Salmonella enterica subsp. enterica]|nr:hypothetical protein KCP71_09140 [Salmonella enterica subsp. enterica]
MTGYNNFELALDKVYPRPTPKVWKTGTVDVEKSAGKSRSHFRITYRFNTSFPIRRAPVSIECAALQRVHGRASWIGFISYRAGTAHQPR